MKRRIRLTESDLHRVIKESVKRVINEGMVGNNQWKYEGTREDRYMWALKKDAEAKGMTREDGWPSYEYIQKWLNHADHQFEAGFDIGVSGPDYSLSNLWDCVDNYLYRRDLETGPDVLGRQQFGNRGSNWFKKRRLYNALLA